MDAVLFREFFTARLPLAAALTLQDPQGRDFATSAANIDPVFAIIFLDAFILRMIFFLSTPPPAIYKYGFML
jgi:hypothetical protein